MKLLGLVRARSGPVHNHLTLETRDSIRFVTMEQNDTALCQCIASTGSGVETVPAPPPTEDKKGKPRGQPTFESHRALLQISSLTACPFHQQKLVQ